MTRVFSDAPLPVAEEEESKEAEMEGKELLTVRVVLK